MRPPVFVTGLGALSCAHSDVEGLKRALRSSPRQFRIVSSFPALGQAASIPVAQAASGTWQTDSSVDPALPRTHRLALAAAREALAHAPAPDALVLGTTTGGIASTEEGLKGSVRSPDAYRFHGLETVASVLADEFRIHGPVLTVSTACSSSTVALALAFELLRFGLAKRVLAGGADSLCRLTLHGFSMLQLVDPRGATPLDVDRRGMTVGEGAAFLLLETAPAAPHRAIAELAGYGLSCDAHHATKPHPEGLGAKLAADRALASAAVSPSQLDYVNLHGTGTPDNDALELRAMHDVFPDAFPPMSSTKGMTGHTLAASGALESVICALALSDGLLPANVGLQTPDPALGVQPIREPVAKRVDVALTNSFGFGGNNASLVLRKPSERLDGQPSEMPSLRVIASCCLTGAGATEPTWNAFLSGTGAGTVSPTALPTPQCLVAVGYGVSHAW